MKNLDKRKKLASKVLGVGTYKIVFDINRLEEIKEAITKQDIKDLFASGAITIRETRGRKTKIRRKNRRGPGKIKFKVRNTKRDYMVLTRKLRFHVKELRKQGKIDKDQFLDLRKKIKAKMFKDKQHLKAHIGGQIS